MVHPKVCIMSIHNIFPLLMDKGRIRIDPIKLQSGSLLCSMARRMSTGLRVLGSACSESMILTYSDDTSWLNLAKWPFTCNRIFVFFLNDMYHAPCFLGSTPWRAPSPEWRWRPNGVLSLKICNKQQGTCSCYLDDSSDTFRWSKLMPDLIQFTMGLPL